MEQTLLNGTLHYLGCDGRHADTATLSLARQAIGTMTALADFRCCEISLSDLGHTPDFVLKPAYATIAGFVAEASLFAATLGIRVDRKIKSLGTVDMSAAVAANAAANAILDARVEAALTDGQVLFCPGYSGTDMSDVRHVLQLLDAQRRLGIFTSDSGMMIPEKSVAGLLLKGYRFSCRGCLIASKCEHLRCGLTCYGRQD